MCTNFAIIALTRVVNTFVINSFFVFTIPKTIFVASASIITFRSDSFYSVSNIYKYLLKIKTLLTKISIKCPTQTRHIHSAKKNTIPTTGYL